MTAHGNATAVQGDDGWWTATAACDTCHKPYTTRSTDEGGAKSSAAQKASVCKGNHKKKG